MRKTLIATLISSLTFGFSAPSLAAPKSPIKVSGKCFKAGEQNKSGTQALVCTKLNKKLSWQPSVAAIELAIWNDLQKLQIAQPEISTSLELHISPNANKNAANSIVAAFNSAARLWQAQYVPDKPLPVLIYSEKDRDWFISQMNALGVYSEHQLSNFDNEVSRNGARANGAGVTGDGGRLWATFFIGTARSTQDYMDYQIPAHEYTHLAQYQISGQQEAGRSCWQIEGGGFFYGIFLGAKTQTQLKQFTKLRNTDPGFAGFPGIIQSGNADWESYLDKFGQNFQNTPCGPNGAYAVGSLAHEYLYSLKGHAGIIAFLQKTGELKDFAAAIENVYGKPWPVIRKEIATYIQLAAAQN